MVMARNLGLRQAVTRPEFAPELISVTTSLSTTPAIDLRGVSAWAVRSPASAVTSLEVWASSELDGTYTRVQISASDLAVALSGAKWNTPDFSVFPFSYLKLVGNAAGVIEMVSKG
jgi:hypothetical protein